MDISDVKISIYLLEAPTKRKCECDFLLCAFCHVMPLADSRTRCCHVYEHEKDSIPQPSSQPQLLLPFF